MSSGVSSAFSFLGLRGIVLLQLIHLSTGLPASSLFLCHYSVAYRSSGRVIERSGDRSLGLVLLFGNEAVECLPYHLTHVPPPSTQLVF